MEKNPPAIMPPTADSKIQYTTEDGFLMTIPQDLEYNKTECTDVSIISTTEAQPKMPLVALYSNLSSALPLPRKDQTKKFSPGTHGSRIPSIPSPHFFQVQEDKDGEEDSVPTNFVFPKETSNYPVKPKLLFKSPRSEVPKSSDLSKNAADIRFTSKQIVHTDSSSISSGSSPGSPAAEFSNRSPSKPYSSRFNPWTQTKLTHQPPSNLPNSQRMSGNFSSHAKRLANENSSQSKAESSQQHSIKRTTSSFAPFAKRASLFKFFTVGREPSSQALGMINDKSYVQTDPKTPKIKSIRRQSIPKLTKLLRKHAISREMTRSGTQLFNLIAVIKKKRMGFFEKLKTNLKETCFQFKQNMRTALKSLKYFVKPLRPDSNLRWIWDGVILIFIIISLVTVPFNLCFRFSNSVIADDQINFLEASNIIIFLLDILLNFHTAYYLDGNIVFESRSIALNYLKTWFFFDLLASCPYQLVGSLMEESAQVVYSPDGKVINPFKSPKFLMKFMCILQLIRIFKLRILLAKFESHLDLNRLLNGVFSLVKLFTMVSFIAHWCACGWHLITVDIENGDWLIRVGLDEAEIEDRYIVSLYFCLTTLLTVGFGDIVPQTSIERVYTIFIMLIGGCVFGYVMNSIAVIVYSLEDEKTKVRNKIASLCKYMHKEGLAKDVQHDIRKYLEFLVEGRHTMKQSDKEMLDMLSQDLRGRFYEQMNGKLLYGSRLLANNFTKRLLYTVSAAIEERTYTPQEKVFDHLDIECSVYYISRGCIEFFHITGVSPALTLKSGHTFGEIAFFTNMPRVLSAKSVEFSRLLFIKRERFLESLDDHPQDKEMFCMIRDRVVNYEEYKILELKCAVCQGDDHLLEKCPQVRYVPDVQEIVKNHLEEASKFRKSFQRMERKRFHALASLKPIEIACFNMCRNHFDKLMEIKGPDLPSLFFDEPEEQRSKSIGRPSISLPFHSNTHHKSHALSESAPKNLRFSTVIVKDASRDTKTMLAGLNSRKLEEMKLRHPENIYSAQMMFKIKDGELIPVDNDFENLENFEFDRVMTYPVYFPHNNINKIVDRMEKKEKGTANSSEETKKLKNHLSRFFKALEKQRAREKLTNLPVRRGRSRSLLKIFEK